MVGLVHVGHIDWWVYLNQLNQVIFASCRRFQSMDIRRQNEFLPYSMPDSSVDSLARNGIIQPVMQARLLSLPKLKKLRFQPVSSPVFRFWNHTSAYRNIKRFYFWIRDNN